MTILDFAQVPNDGEPIHSGKHAIDCHDRVFGGMAETKSVVAIHGEIGLVAARP